MDVYFASLYSRPHLKDSFLPCKFILESFYTIRKWELPLIKNAQKFMLDSGAFSFMGEKNKKNINWKKYIEDYANFINNYDIKLFFELDIDSIVGYEKVKEYRQLLEQLTGKQCIPVWHKSRGLSEFYKMCDEYKYVAIGGIASHEIVESDYKYLIPFIDIAHKKNCKIHGLGFTVSKWLSQIKFDSVDSSSWLMGSIFGRVFLFTGKNIKYFFARKHNQKIKNRKELETHNIKEWIKFQSYAERNL